MKLTAHRKSLLKIVNQAIKFCDPKSVMSILGMIKLTADKHGLVVNATDLGVAYQSLCTANVTRDGGVCVSAKDLLVLAKSGTSDEVSFEATITRTEAPYTHADVSITKAYSDTPEQHLAKVEAELARLQATGFKKTCTLSPVIVTMGSIKRTLHAVTPDDYPALPDMSTLIFNDLDAKAFSDMIDKVAFSISTDETRFHLNGMFLKAEGEALLAVSTDGHRLSIVERNISVTGPNEELSKGVIIPRKGLLLVQKLLDEKSTHKTSIALRGSNIYFARGDARIAIKQIDAQYPDYEQVIPTKNNKQAIVHREQLAEALRAVIALGDANNFGARFAFSKDTCQITTEDADRNPFETEIPCEWTGADLVIGFNCKYLLDPLEHMSSIEVQIQFRDDISPCLMTPKDDQDYVCVIMPMRI